MLIVSEIRACVLEFKKNCLKDVVGGAFVSLACFEAGVNLAEVGVKVAVDRIPIMSSAATRCHCTWSWNRLI